MKGISALSSLLAFVVSFWELLQAHRSLPEGVTCGSQFNSSALALNIPDAKISWASYRILTCDAPILWLKGTMDAGQWLAFTAGVPVLPRLADARIGVLVIGPGLPPLSTASSAKVPQSVVSSIPQGEGAVLVESPQDQSTCAHVNSETMGASSEVKDGRCHFHEEWAGSHSWVLIDSNVSTVQAGVHHFAVFATTQTSAKVWFACCDWPEDFRSQYSIPDADCPYCGTKANNPGWADLFYEQKTMAQHGGFPALDSCANSTMPPTAPSTAQCPSVPDSPSQEQSEGCKLGCSNGECHSHNVLGVCNYTVRWVTPNPTVGNANVTTLRIFAGESVKFTSLGHMFPHNLFAMESIPKLAACDFQGSSEVGNVGDTKMGVVIKYTQPGTYLYACSIGSHCLQGQKLTVIVQDASEGMRCHSHKVAPSAAAVNNCSSGLVKASVVNSSSYGSIEGQCSEMCTTQAAMQWMAGAKQSSCKDQGFDVMIEAKQVQPPGSSTKMAVIIMGKADACPGMLLAYMVASQAYGASAKECSEFCTSPAALQWMADAKAGSCKDAGFEKRVKVIQIQPAGSPAKMSVTIMAKESSCHCHSYEKIDCADSGDALYAEHVDEIVAHCAGAISGTDAVCPYKCHQPFEVLHLHYLECNTRGVDPTYVKVNNTALCHQAATADSESKCDGSQGSKTTTTRKQHTTTTTTIKAATTTITRAGMMETTVAPTAMRTTTTTTIEMTAVPIGIVVRAKVVITFRNPVEFVTSPHALTIMQHAISHASKDLTTNMITIESLKVSTGIVWQGGPASMQRLAGGVDCQFTATYPPTHTGPTFAAASIDTAKMKTAITDKAASMGLIVTVTSIVVSEPVPVTATTPKPQKIGTVVGAAFSSRPNLVIALMFSAALVRGLCLHV